MRQDFQRADFGLLIGDDELLDGNELSIGFVRIAADGLYSTYTHEGREKPALDMNFNPGKAVLPFPFTLEQFKAFGTWHPLFIPEIIELRFTNDDATIDNEALAELDDRSLLAGTLVRSILGIPVEAEAEVELDEPAKTEPGPATDTAITAPVAVVASVEPAESKPVNRGWVMKKAATHGVMVPVVAATVIHSTRARRDFLTPVIELAQTKCFNQKDTAEVWAVLQVLSKEKVAPLIGATDQGLQYLTQGDVKFFTRKSLGKRLARQDPPRPAKTR